MIWFKWILKTRRLTNIYLFLNLTIEECTFDIHLKHVYIVVDSKGQEQTNNFQSCYRGKSFIIVNALFLSKTLNH
ncbi:hypothetical protein HanRHA438_Chr09g0382311 [Helianthus annuus]|nr:hypothetical protein HanRHA438_Chr09g0382311 [Helianthus annuus]